MIEINLFWIFTFIIVVVIAFILLLGFINLLGNKKDIHFKDKDTSITSSLIDKFPLVSPDFINKSAKEQNVENNQEIHEINKKLDEMEDAIRTFAKITEELAKRG